MPKDFNLLNDVYFPSKEKSFLKDSSSFQFMKENGVDPNPMLGIAEGESVMPIKYDKLMGENAEDVKEYFKTAGESLKWSLPSLTVGGAIGLTNLAQAGVNTVPVLNEIYKNSPLFYPQFQDLANLPENEEELQGFIKHVNEKMPEYTKWMNTYFDDKDVLNKFVGVAGRDLIISLPIFSALSKYDRYNHGAGKYAKYFISGAGGMLGIEKEIDGESTAFTLDSKTLDTLKNYFGAEEGGSTEFWLDEMAQGLEGGAFFTAFPAIADSYRFFKSVPNRFEKMQKGYNLDGDVTVPGKQENFVPPKAPKTIEGEGEELIIPQQLMEGQQPDDNLVAGNPISPLMKNVFKSALESATKKLPQKGSGQQFLGQIKNIPGVKESELKWTGLDDYLKKQKTVTKEDVESYLKENLIRVDEVKLPGKSDNQSKLPEFEEFREMPDIEFRDMDEVNTIYNHLNEMSLHLTANANQRFDMFSAIENFSGKNSGSQGLSISAFAVAQKFRMDDPYSEDNPIFANYLDDWMDYYSDGIYQFNSGQRVNQELDFEQKAPGVGDVVYKFYNKKFNPDMDYQEHLYLNKDEFEELKEYLSNAGIELQSYSKLEYSRPELKKIWNELGYRNYEDMNDNYNINSADYLGAASPKFQAQTLDGGDDYTEIILRMVDPKGKPVSMENYPVIQDRPLPEKMNLLAANKMIYSQTDETINPSAHFGYAGEFAHVRFKTRNFPSEQLTGYKNFPDLKTLAIEESQSDMNIQATKANEMIDKKVTSGIGGKISDFPFKNSWHELVVKRLVHYAAENGFDAIAVPAGKAAGFRYREIGGIGQSVEFQLENSGNRQYVNVIYRDAEGDEIFANNFSSNPRSSIDEMIKLGFPKHDLEYLKSWLDGGASDGVLTKQLTEKKYYGKGEGKQVVYDKMFPSFMKKYGKKFKAKTFRHVEREIGEDGASIPFFVLEINDEMKDAALKGNQTLFNILGLLGAGVAADKVQDSNTNNTISKPTNNM